MVNIYKLKLTILQYEILRVLFMKAEITFTARALAKALEVSQPAISKALPALEKEGFITVRKDKESKRLSIRLNKVNKRVMELKRSENLKMLYESGLPDFLEEELPGATIILFGSYSRGDDTSVSDIDIAVIGRKEKEIDLAQFERILGKKITMNFYDSLETVHKSLRENICNGIVLTGGIEL
ncbi:MAG: MarR family transcriptional regulator [Candidatus Woesearchaeota archaeon]